MTGVDHAIQVEKTVTINRSAEDLYSVVLTPSDGLWSVIGPDANRQMRTPFYADRLEQIPMTDPKTRLEAALSEEEAKNPGARTAAIHESPEILKEEAENANEGDRPNAAGGASKPGGVEDHVPSTSVQNQPICQPLTDLTHHRAVRKVRSQPMEHRPSLGG